MQQFGLDVLEKTIKKTPKPNENIFSEWMWMLERTQIQLEQDTSS